MAGCHFQEGRQEIDQVKTGIAIDFASLNGKFHTEEKNMLKSIYKDFPTLCDQLENLSADPDSARRKKTE